MAFPTLQQVYRELKAADPDNDGVLYSLTEKNKLPDDWIVATPDLFGRPASPLDPDHSRKLTDTLYEVIANAQSSADLAALGVQLPGGAMKTTLKKALKALSDSGRDVTVRLVFGDWRLSILPTESFLKEITEGLTSKKLKVYVAQINTSDNSWNHAKILAADGKVAMIVGHNWYADDYLGSTPIFDLSVKVEGPAAKAAQDFVNRLWKFVARYNSHLPHSRTYSNSFVGGTLGRLAAPQLTIPAPTGSGSLQILGVANPANGLLPLPKDASRAAMLRYLRAAEESIYVSQMDLVSKNVIYEHDSEIFDALARLLIVKRGVVGIVLTNPGAKIGGSGSYWMGAQLSEVHYYLRESCRRVDATLPLAEIDRILAAHLFLATIRFNHTDAQWAPDKPIGNHAKLWIVDRSSTSAAWPHWRSPRTARPVGCRTRSPTRPWYRSDRRSSSATPARTPRGSSSSRPTAGCASARCAGMEPSGAGSGATTASRRADGRSSPSGRGRSRARRASRYAWW
jgi:phosphatidylserine/phosphatidylglycerophosphate/cardiolipin synthase-like enzyme